MMPGGVVCWAVRDQMRRGSLTGTTYRQMTFFMRLGFCLDNIIYAATKGFRKPETERYAEQVRPCFILSKGKPRTFNPIKDRENSTAGRPLCYSRRSRDGRQIGYAESARTAKMGVRGNVWEYATGGNHTTTDILPKDRPALMPEALAHDLIISWSRPGDVVLDPLGGAGTTAKMALLSDRQYLSFEVHEPYHEIAVRRLAEAHEVNRRRLVVALGLG